MEFLTLILRKVFRAIGVACLHVTLFVILHGLVNHAMAREMPRMLDSVIEMFSEAVAYTAVP